MAISQISVTELADYLCSGCQAQLVDVREPEELAIAQITGFLNLPLSQFEAWGSRIHEILDRNTETLVLCHHGVRSMQMCHWLEQQGFSQLKNIAHGIDAYAQLVDRAIARY